MRGIRGWIGVEAKKMNGLCWRESVELHMRRMEGLYLEYEKALIGGEGMVGGVDRWEGLVECSWGHGRELLWNSLA